METYFIFGLCDTCGEPSSIIKPWDYLGFNDFPGYTGHDTDNKEIVESTRNQLIEKLQYYVDNYDRYPISAETSQKEISLEELKYNLNYITKSTVVLKCNIDISNLHVCLKCKKYLSGWELNNYCLECNHKPIGKIENISVYSDNTKYL